MSLCWAVLVLHRYFSFYDDSLLVAQGLYGVEHACGLFYAAVVAHAANPSWRIEVHVDGLVGESSLYSVTYLLRAVLVVARVSAGVCLHSIAVYLVSAHHHLLARVYYGDVQAVAIVAEGVILLCGAPPVGLVLARLFLGCRAGLSTSVTEVLFPLLAVLPLVVWGVRSLGLGFAHFPAPPFPLTNCSMAAL